MAAFCDHPPVANYLVYVAHLRCSPIQAPGAAGPSLQGSACPERLAFGLHQGQVWEARGPRASQARHRVALGLLAVSWAQTGNSMDQLQAL